MANFNFEKRFVFFPVIVFENLLMTTDGPTSLLTDEISVRRLFDKESFWKFDVQLTLKMWCANTVLRSVILRAKFITLFSSIASHFDMKYKDLCIFDFLGYLCHIENKEQNFSR